MVLTVILIFPEPAIVAFKVSVVKSYAFILPEPAIEQSNSIELPDSFIFPEPPILESTLSASTRKVIFPDPPKATVKSLLFMIPSFVMFPDPPKETLSISL